MAFGVEEHDNFQLSMVNKKAAAIAPAVSLQTTDVTQHIHLEIPSHVSELGRQWARVHH